MRIKACAGANVIHNHHFFIDGQWVDPVTPRKIDVINPATEEAFAQISLGSAADVDKAVAATRRAFETFSQTSKEERLALLRRILEEYMKRYDDFAVAVSQEMGAPLQFAKEEQSYCGMAHLKSTIKALETFAFEEQRGATRIVREGIGVEGLITPWNWPLSQIASKVAPAIAAGCTMILKPSELSPLNALIWAEVMEAAGTPVGAFNLINGDGPGVGTAMSSHPGIDMMSFTGSTRAGIMVAKSAADTVKRVSQELGGKSPNIILDDADLEDAVGKGVRACLSNSGQSCNAPTRMLVQRGQHDAALKIAKRVAEEHKVGDPNAADTVLGPVVSTAQYNKIQALIESGIKEGATLVTGGMGRPDGINRGAYVRPTIFGNVTPDMTIAREEIFGPVLSIMPYDSEAEAISIANDTVYGLSAAVSGTDLARARRVARQIRAGQVKINSPAWDTFAPFGGYKQSGNGREYADWGIHDFLEIKALIGHDAA
jgi:aldehyde dehydrogenase (NAD+)